jgi:hypothetical protein
MASSGEQQNGTHQIELSHDAWGRLVFVDASGERCVGVEPIRAFPLSEPGRWISLCNSEGREVLFVEDLGDLPASARSVLSAELATREFVPVIERILDTTGGIYPVFWDVETDRGPTRIELDTDDDLRRIGPHRILITDAKKSRFVVPDSRALDAHSRRILDRHV